MKIYFFTGGARSGKSRLAEAKVSQISEQFKAQGRKHDVNYIATAPHIDEEFDERISLHQQGRPAQWRTIECQFDIDEVLVSKTSSDSNPQVFLIDCLTLWLSNIIYKHETAIDDEHSNNITPIIEDYRERFIQTLKTLQAQNDDHHVIIVSNEVGQGIVPIGRSTRLFVDHAGWLNQAVAQLANEATACLSGLPLALK